MLNPSYQMGTGLPKLLNLDQSYYISEDGKPDGIGSGGDGSTDAFSGGRNFRSRAFSGSPDLRSQSPGTHEQLDFASQRGTIRN